MATAANFLISVGPEEWDAKIYGVLSSTSSLVVAVRNRANVVRIAYSLYKINKTLAETFSNMYERLEGKRPVEPVTEPVTPQRLHEVADNVDRLARMLEYLCEQMKRARLTNNSLTAGSLYGIQKRVEEIKDVADWFETAAQSDEVNAVFDRAQGEKERGEVFDLSQVE
jgi:NADPH:quinone reductase-like Zn-dependent oxidoreductase